MKKMVLLLPFIILTACGDKTPSPYDATGSWGLSVINTDPVNGTKTVAFPDKLTVVMTNKTTGDFKIDYPYQGVSTTIMTGNTSTGLIHFAPGNSATGQLNFVDCKGAFNAAQNTYSGLCAPSNTSVADWEAQGYKMVLNMSRQ